MSSTSKDQCYLHHIQCIFAGNPIHPGRRSAFSGIFMSGFWVFGTLLILIKTIQIFLPEPIHPLSSKAIRAFLGDSHPPSIMAADNLGRGLALQGF